MGAIFLVRHGQAAFGTEDYDRLTEVGHRQGRLLGEYFVRRGISFSALMRGTLRRHSETADAILEGMGELAAREHLVARELTGLNEYNPDALVAAYQGQALVPSGATRDRDPAVMREHFRILRAALLAWARGETRPANMPDWVSFQAGAVAALIEAREQYPNDNVLIVSSGGPISAAVSAALDAPAHTAIELNLRTRNSSVSEFASTAKRHQLVGFNSVAHLETVDEFALVTYA